MNFDTFRKQRPELVDAWDYLEKWFAKHGAKRFVEPALISKDLNLNVDMASLGKALGHMLDCEAITGAYRVRHGDSLLEGQWSIKDDIPDHLPDRICRQMVQTDECEIVFGYAW